MLNNLSDPNFIRFAPNLLTIRLTKEAIPDPSMGLEFPHISNFSNISNAPNSLPISLESAIEDIIKEMQPIGLTFREVNFSRTFQNIDHDFIEQTSSSPNIVATLTQLHGIPPDSDDPLGLTRTFTIYLDFEQLSTEQSQEMQQQAEMFLLDLAGRLENSDPYKIERVNLVPLRFAAYKPTGPEFPKQWHHQVIGSEAAWDVHKGDPGTAIAVIDTGIDLDHRDLRSNIISPGINTTSRSPSSLGLPKGWTVADNYAGINPHTNNPNEPRDEHGHGTHVAGLIAAVDNQHGGVGIAHGCKILPVKSMVRARDSQNRVYAIGNALEIANGIMDASKDDRVRVINLSLGGGVASLDEFIALQTARGFGKLVTIAVGNEAGYRLVYPASFKINRPELMDHILCVGATTKDDFLAPFSNLGSVIDIVAPGENLWSTFPGNNYTSQSGTSMAAPVVAGVAALLFSRSPHLTPQLAAAMIKSTSVRLGIPTPNVYFGFGRVSASGVLPK